MNLDKYVNLIESFKMNGYNFRGFEDEIQKRVICFSVMM
jgi:hypothetical protein